MTHCWRMVLRAEEAHATPFLSYLASSDLSLGTKNDLCSARNTIRQQGLNLARTQVVNEAHFEPGDFIIRQGDVGDQFYVIVSGEVEVFKELPSGQKIPLARLGRGEFFGETALMTGRRRNASVRATSPVDLMCLGRDEFNNLAGA